MSMMWYIPKAGKEKRWKATDLTQKKGEWNDGIGSIWKAYNKMKLKNCVCIVRREKIGI